MRNELDGDKELFFDEFSQRYFEATPLQVKEAEYRINRDLRMRDYVYANELNQTANSN